MLESLSTARMRFLIVEDEPDDAELLRYLMSDRYEVDIAETLARALKMIDVAEHSTGSYDAILIDLKLPDSPNPDDTYQSIRNRVGGTVPILVFTGYASPELVARLRNAGAAGVVTKSIDGAKEVIRKLEKAALEARLLSTAKINRAELARVALKQARETIASVPPSDQELRDQLQTLIRKVDSIVRLNEEQERRIGEAATIAADADESARMVAVQVLENSARIKDLTPGDKLKVKGAVAAGGLGIITILAELLIRLGPEILKMF